MSVDLYHVDCMESCSDLQTGKAGEYLVCADLILKGFVAYPSEQGLPYDAVLDTGSKLLRVQVKTTTGPRKVPQRNKITHAYIFNIKRAGKNAKRIRRSHEVDIYALVCLDTMQIGYLLPDDAATTINIRVDALRGSYYDEDGQATYAKVVELRGAHSRTSIAGQLDKHVAVISRMCAPGYEPFKSSAKYMSDFVRSKVWFYEI